IKRLELLMEIVPRVKRVAVLRSLKLKIDSVKKSLDTAAPRLRLQVDFYTVSKPAELDIALDRVAAGRYDAILVFEDPIIWTSHVKIAQFAIAHRLPGMYGGVKFVQSGGLISYGPELHELFRRAAGYVDKILKGANPGDLPIQQPTKFELELNLKTAKALGL